MAPAAISPNPGVPASNGPNQYQSGLPYRSWRKKFRKMRVVFDEMMRESNTLFKEEQKAKELAERLRQQNFQLLELLLDINDSDKAPSNMRYQLNGAAGDHTSDADTQTVTVQDGNGSMHSRSLSALLKTVPHTSLLSNPDSFVEAPDDPHPLEFFSFPEQERYIRQLDASLGDSPSTKLSDEDRPSPSMKNMTLEEETEYITKKNPMSVYNWLRIHQPHIFEQNTETTGDKSSKKKKKDTAAANATGTAATGTPVPEPDVDGEEDDTYLRADSFAHSAKAKRTREDDSTYRLKGGSSKPTKRKRKDGDEVGTVKKAKKTAPAPDAT